MAVELVMPRLSESMEEGTVVSWLVPDGTPVRVGQEIAEIETDKATLPYEAPESGVLRILVPEGSTLALGQPIGLIDDLAPLPGGQSVAPPGAGAGGGHVPAPRAPDEEPPTASFEIQPGLHAPHTLHASTPPPGQSPDAAWSPAWGPQPVVRAERTAVQQDVHDEEGETTEFEAVDPGDGLSADAPAYATPPAPGPPPAVIAQAPAPPAEPPAPVQPVTPAQLPAAVAPAPFPAQPPLPWVDPSFSPKTPAAVAIGAPGAADVPAMEPVIAAQEAAAQQAAQAPAGAAPVAPPAPEPSEDGRFTPEDLMAPATLPPRPPELRPAPGAGAQRIAASPVARRLARELGIDLATIEGTGPEGRVVRADIEAAQATGAARPPKQAGATPSIASEFTPPVDDERAAAPIPEVEPGGEPVAEVPVGEPLAVVGDAELAPGEVFGDEDAPAASDAATPAAPEPVVDEPLVDPDAAALAAADALAAEPGGELADADAAPTTADAPAAEAAPPTAEAAADAGPAAPTDAPEASTPPVTDDASAPTATTEPGAADAPPAVDAPGAPTAPAPRGKGDPVIVELTRQQQTVARRMAESKGTIPDFHTVMEIDAGPLVALRAELRTNRPDLAAPSLNDWLIKATAVALRGFPSLNGAYRDGRIEQYPKVNIGLAVDADGTLLVPVVHEADLLAISQIGARTDELVEKARNGGLRPPDIASATFTLSNLGTLGVDQFTAVITPGQSAILTVGRIAERPVARDGQIVAAPTIILTLTTDHRAVYGAEAARFLGRVKQLLEHPTSLLA